MSHGRKALAAGVAVGLVWAGGQDVAHATRKPPPPDCKPTPAPVPPVPEVTPEPPAPVPPPVVAPPPGDVGSGTPEIGGVPPAPVVEVPVVLPPPDYPVVVTPVVRLGDSSRVFTTRAKCRSYAKRPVRAVGPKATPRYGQVRVKRAANGRLYGYSDRFRIVRVTSPRGKVSVRVKWLPGPWCGPSSPAVAG